MQLQIRAGEMLNGDITVMMNFRILSEDRIFNNNNNYEYRRLTMDNRQKVIDYMKPKFDALRGNYEHTIRDILSDMEDTGDSLSYDARNLCSFAKNFANDNLSGFTLDDMWDLYEEFKYTTQEIIDKVRRLKRHVSKIAKIRDAIGNLTLTQSDGIRMNAIPTPKRLKLWRTVGNIDDDLPD